MKIVLTIDDTLSKQFIKDLEGEVQIKEENSFGFIKDVFCHPSIIKKYNLKDNQQISGKAIRAYNKEKCVWGWKVFEINF
jgi:transcription termination factor Rho